MAAWNANDNYKQSNVAAATYSFKLRGGYYWFEFNGTGAGTVDLKRLGPNGSTYTARITQIVATVGQQSIALAPGDYQVVITGFTANYFEVTRIQMAVE